MHSIRYSQNWMWYVLLGILLVIILITALAPAERTLGARVRLVYFHGAWVWTGKIAFAAAAGCGLVGLVLPAVHPARRRWQRTSVALAWTGLLFWVTYLPLSLWVQQINWGGIFWDEPRWRIPFMFGIVGVLLQTGLLFMEDLRLSSAANIAYGAALWWFLGNIENVLHPDSPIFQSEALMIQLFFSSILVLSLVFGALLARLLYRYVPAHWK